MNNSNKPVAFRWFNCKIESIDNIELINENDLLFIDNQKNIARKNIVNFVSNKPYLHMFLWGSRGTGKSSLVKMLLNLYKDRGLKVIEFPQESIHTIYALYRFIRENNDSYFLIFFDDISFDEDDLYFRKFKSTMEGGLEETPHNCMYVATSNKRHIIKEKANGNSDDIYNFDMVNEELSLFARFGLAIPFPLLTRREYLEIVKFYLSKFSIEDFNNVIEEAENFAIDRGGRSPRIAKQFSIYCTLNKL